MATGSKTKGDYFAINRQLIKSDFWTSEKFTKPQAWIDLIGLARFADGEAYKRGIEIPLNRGQLCWSEVELSDRWSWSRPKVKRFLSVLQKKQQILQQKTNVTTVMTIVNYDLYQPSVTANVTPNVTANVTAEVQQTLQQACTKEECNKEKKVIKKKTIRESDDCAEADEFWVSKKHRKLSGKRLDAFKRLWEAFEHKKDRANAIDAFLDIQNLTDSIMDEMCKAARLEAAGRASKLARGSTPIYLQGWLNGRRWEDEVYETESKHSEPRCL